MDAVGSNIRVDARGREVMRVLPRVNEAINEEWISDKTRQHVDGLRMQRLDRPFLRENGRLRPATWHEAFLAIAAKVKGAEPRRIGAIAGDLAGVEEMYALKLLMTALGSGNIDCRQDGSVLSPAYGRASYLFNPTIAGIEDADAILIVAANPRHEAAMINARIRKRWRLSPVAIGVVGPAVDLTYPYDHIGAGAGSVGDVTSGKHSFAEKLGVAKKPMIILGAGAAARPDGAAVLAAIANLATAIRAVTEEWNGLAILHSSASRVGALDIGFVPATGGLSALNMAKAGALDVLFNLGADEIDIAPGAFVVYQGTHGDRGAHRADVILPGAAYTEKSATYVNTEGAAADHEPAVFPPGDAREDWAILRALSDIVGRKLPFDSLAALRKGLYGEYPHLGRLETIEPADGLTALVGLSGLSGMPGRDPFTSSVRDFYLTNPIARASRVMAECSALAAGSPALQAAE